MRHVTDQEFDDLAEGKHEWKPISIHVYSADAGGGYFTLPKLEDCTHLMFQCLRCKSHYLLESCSNCDGTQFMATTRGVFCAQCERGFSSWSCSQCGTENPATKTFFGLTKKGGCFIATAVYGSYDSPEVKLLRLFRDQTLFMNDWGRHVVRVYYEVSPRIAWFLRQHHRWRHLTRVLFIQPLVRMLRRKYGRM
jgi:hypothetical protein